MKYRITQLLVLITIISSLIFLQPIFAEEEESVDITADQINNEMTVEAHVANIGWQNPVTNGNIIGTTGQGLGLEAIKINSSLVKINARAHIQNVGWQDTFEDPSIIGTTGKGLALEALSLNLENAPNVDLYYRTHSANFGWLGWAKNGENAGTTGCGFPIEAIEIVAVPQGSGAPNGESTDNALIDVSDFQFHLNTHVADQGWLDPVSSGISGTIGYSLPLQAIDFTVTDPLNMSGAVGQAYVRNIGWQEEKDPNYPIGTEGQNLPMEAFRYRLSGPAAQVFSLNYSAHVSNLGWLGTTSNFNVAGTMDGAIPIECVNIQVVPKGAEVIEGNAFKKVDIPCKIIPPAPTSIVINKSLQTMALYENYDLTVHTNVVTGMQWCDDTLAGTWKVEEKLPHYRTVGPGYDATVDYWLTLYVGPINGFDGGTIVDRVGIHDADWRTDWSPTAYLNNGSHGCVNTPYNAMQYIYNHVSVGTPVKIR